MAELNAPEATTATRAALLTHKAMRVNDAR